jgi:hypothetical protein
MSNGTKACGFYSNNVDIFYVTPAGRTWLVANPDGGPLEEQDQMPADVEPIDGLMDPTEAIAYCEAIEAESGEKLSDRAEAEMGFVTLFETGQNDAHWSIEERDDGVLVCSSNAETRRVFGPEGYQGWNMDSFRNGLVGDGVSPELAERVIAQIERRD